MELFIGLDVVFLSFLYFIFHITSFFSHFFFFNLKYLYFLFVFIIKMEMVMEINIAQLYKKERNKLLGFIRKRIANPDTAEDILQDVFYRLVEGFSVTEPIENLAGWLYSVAKNRIIDWYRKKRLYSISGVETGEGIHLLDVFGDNNFHPEKILYQELFAEELARSLQKLPEKQRYVFIQHELEGKSFKEISQETGDTINTLISRKRYAVLFLRERLKAIKKILSSI